MFDPTKKHKEQVMSKKQQIRFLFQDETYEFRGHYRLPVLGEHYLAMSTFGQGVVSVADHDFTDEKRCIVHLIPVTIEYAGVVYEKGPARVAELGETILRHGVPSGVRHRTTNEYPILSVVGLA